MDGYESYRKIIEHAAHFKNDRKVDAQQGFKDLEARIGRKPKVISLKSRIKAVTSIAAAIAVLFAGYLFFNEQQSTQVSTRLAEHRELTLPDASEVYLNADSEIAYDKDQWSTNRSLTLKGEAFFKVEKGSAFKVRTSDGWVQVLGTQFNVFNREGIFKVNCFEGSVKVGVDHKEVILKPGEGIQVINGKMAARSSRSNEPSWLQGKSSFESMPLSAVLHEIERQYGVQITLEKEPENNEFTGVFSHDNLNEALRSVCQPFRLQFVIKGNQVKVSPVEQ
jgi:ferric-dicitrate binding protein FerR (iron transport regulator)